MLLKRANLKFWLNVAATALLMVVPAWRAGRRRLAWKGLVGTERPFGEPQSSEEPYDVELRRARERGRGRHGEAGTTSSVVPIARCRRIASYPSLAVFHFSSS